MPARPLPLLALVALVALLAGCGGGPSPQEVARDFLTSNEPAKCELLTRSLLERQTGRLGADAVRFCGRNVGRTSPARDVRLVESEVRNGEATVEVIADGREERFVLVKERDGWRIADFPR